MSSKVSYEIVRRFIQNGDIIICKEKNWWPSVGFAFWIKERLWILEAIYHLIPVSKLEKQRVMLYAIKSDSRINGDKVINYALEHCGKSHFHCSEFATRALMSAGFKLEKEPSSITPCDVMNFSCLNEPLELVRNGRATFN